MPKSLLLSVCLLAFCASAAFAGVTVTSPTNGATVSGSVTYKASATASSCSKGVASMGIYSAPGVLAYVVNGASLNTTLTLGTGTHYTTVEEWDYCGGAATAPITVTVTSGGGSGVAVSAPANNSSVGSPVNFSASATSSCSKGVASMGIYTAPSVLAYVVNGSSLNTSLSLSAGTYNTVVQEWDNCGGSATTPVTITVTGGSSGKSFTNVQHSGGWSGYAQRAPNWTDCSPSPCDNVTYSMTQNVKSPAMSGESTSYYVGGSQGYGDALWNNHLIGDLSSQGVTDSSHTLVPTLHNFTYDVYFWMGNPSLSQALEFDINQFFSSMGFIWGHECRIGGGNQWDVYDNVNQRWVATGISCYPNANSWNHVVIQVQRTSDNKLLYQSIALNGVTHTLNQYYSHGSAPSDWWGITINFQADGNSSESAYTTYLDELTFNYQ
jgi:hypothetical protein